MVLDIIITSYNRPQKALELALSMSKSDLVSDCIIVDSGSNSYPKSNNFRVIETSHKNQPYQRYLGYVASKSNWLLYLDDDMEPIRGWEEVLFSLIENKGTKIKAFALSFIDKHENSYLKRTESSIFSGLSQTKIFVKFIRQISGYPILANGEFTFNGVKGSLPKNGGFVKYFGGGAFMASRHVLYRNFNMQLFSLYERRLGKGEDGILGYTVFKFAPIYYCPTPVFVHNDQGNSVYTRNDFEYNRLVAFSRLYLSCEFCRLNDKLIFFGKLSYLNYSFWRVLGLCINTIFNPGNRKLHSLIGYLKGVFAGLGFRFDEHCSSNNYWITEAHLDLKNELYTKNTALAENDSSL